MRKMASYKSEVLRHVLFICVHIYMKIWFFDNGEEFGQKFGTVERTFKYKFGNEFSDKFGSPNWHLRM